MALSRDKHKLVITIDNIGPADAIALKKMFEYMQYLGNIGSSRRCAFYADGDGSFHPKVSFDYGDGIFNSNFGMEYQFELPEVSEISGVIETRGDSNGMNRGDFYIDSDDIAWHVYHDPEEFENQKETDEELGILRPDNKIQPTEAIRATKLSYNPNEWEDEKPGYPRKMNGLGNF